MVRPLEKVWYFPSLILKLVFANVSYPCSQQFFFTRMMVIAYVIMALYMSWTPYGCLDSYPL